MELKNIKISYIGGGSQNWARTIMYDLAAEDAISGHVSLYDIDFARAENNAVIGNRLKNINGCIGDWTYRADKTLEESLTGADFVFISILPGSFEDMSKDVHLPEKCGIYQSVGDTVGLGGFSRAVRTLPMFAEFAKGIKKYCPNAWVFNYTNPMSVCTKTLTSVFPKIKVLGCCHEVFHTQTLLKDMLKAEHNIEVASRADIKVNVLGINHFTWFDSATYGTTDLFPLYKEFSEKYYDGYFKEQKEWWEKTYFSSGERVKFDMFKNYGLIAAAGDRHLAEFMPANWYLKDDETVEKWKFSRTPVSWRIESAKEKAQETLDIVDGKKEIEIKDSGEEGVSIMKALSGMGDLVTNTNIPNIGQIENLPLGTIVETNALFRKDNIQPVFAGSLPKDLLCMVEKHANNQNGIVEAILEKNTVKLKNLFLEEPMVLSSGVSRNDAEKLYEELILNSVWYEKWLAQ